MTRIFTRKYPPPSQAGNLEAAPKTRLNATLLIGLIAGPLKLGHSPVIRHKPLILMMLCRCRQAKNCRPTG